MVVYGMHNLKLSMNLTFLDKLMFYDLRHAFLTLYFNRKTTTINLVLTVAYYSNVSQISTTMCTSSFSFDCHFWVQITRTFPHNLSSEWNSVECRK